MITHSQSLSSVARALFARRWIRFGVMGGISTLSYFLFGHLLVTILALPLFPGNALAYLLSFLISYLGQCRWTFQVQGVHKGMVPRYALVQGIGLGINSCLIWLLRYIGISYTMSMPAAALLVAVVTYLLCKYFVFKNSSVKG